MSRKKDLTAQVLRQLFAGFLRLPWKARIGIVVALFFAGGIFYVVNRQLTAPQPAPAVLPGGSNAIAFCFWNVENLFDDRDDRRRQPDEQYDSWFVADPQTRQMKYQKLTDALLKLNNGTGPDIIACCEVESVRAAEMLREALNASLPAGASKYDYLAMIEIDAGRHIAPCVISRYPLTGTKLLGKRQRILETRVAVNGHVLVLVASHWTSQLSDDGSNQTGGRAGYATTIRDAYATAVAADRNVDYLVSGDFNDAPDADSVANQLRVTGDAARVRAGGHPALLFGPLTDKSPDEFGTLNYRGKPLIYDQIALSPGMLDDSGWGYVADSVRVPTDGLIRAGTRGRKPWRFGSKTDDALGRGYSDHFPVVVTLKASP